MSHPAPETLNKLASQGIEIYRTDVAGTIVATSDGDVIKLDKNASAIKPHAPPVFKAGSNDDVIVYITRTGEKYHRDGCRYLAKSKIPIKLSEAKSRGYMPCKVCQPPW